MTRPTESDCNDIYKQQIRYLGSALSSGTFQLHPRLGMKVNTIFLCQHAVNIFYSISHFLHFLRYCKYFTLFHIVSHCFTQIHSDSHYTHLVVRLPTQRLSLQADPDTPMARTRSLNPNLSRNLRFLLSWQLHQPNDPGWRPPGRRRLGRQRRPNQALQSYTQALVHCRFLSENSSFPV